MRNGTFSKGRAALQPQTGLRRAVAGFVPAKAGVEPGELREIDGGGPPSAVLLRRTGGSESPAKRLNGGGTPFFSIVHPLNPCRVRPSLLRGFRDGCRYGLNLRKLKTGDSNFRIAGQTFSPSITVLAPDFSHGLARCRANPPAVGKPLADQVSCECSLRAYFRPRNANTTRTMPVLHAPVLNVFAPNIAMQTPPPINIAARHVKSRIPYKNTNGI